ncbi:hypothetical protein [Halodesulfurarchaeum formicicum]|uniref:Uncharacterized protein n=1 Tax=Halodesulfurarchaeum formicicum TaxID=1873524 RepID=A0A1J1AE33_9EURY|nr:hypothetical protein [Halodesulfurarchaeum formicicum]APE96406.1 hypothetical protein HSR6_1975 [Halodesulfurarchaeum formicicum]
MTETESAFRTAKDELSLLRWVWGWHPVVGPAMIVFLLGGMGYYFGLGSWLTPLALVVAVPIWYQGMRYINRNYDTVKAGYLSDVEQFGPAVLEAAGMDESATVYRLVSVPADRLPFVEAPTKVEAAMVGVGEDAVWIYDQTTLDLMFLKGTVGTEPVLVRTLDYGTIESVAYEDGEFVIDVPDTAEEETVQLPSSDPPTELLADLRARLD